MTIAGSGGYWTGGAFLFAIGPDVSRIANTHVWLATLHIVGVALTHTGRVGLSIFAGDVPQIWNLREGTMRGIVRATHSFYDDLNEKIESLVEHYKNNPRENAQCNNFEERELKPMAWQVSEESKEKSTNERPTVVLKTKTPMQKVALNE